MAIQRRLEANNNSKITSERFRRGTWIFLSPAVSLLSLVSLEAINWRSDKQENKQLVQMNLAGTRKKKILYDNYNDDLKDTPQRIIVLYESTRKTN